MTFAEWEFPVHYGGKDYILKAELIYESIIAKVNIYEITLIINRR